MEWHGVKVMVVSYESHGDMGLGDFTEGRQRRCPHGPQVCPLLQPFPKGLRRDHQTLLEFLGGFFVALPWSTGDR